jgi:hypothetical protein
MPGQKTKPTDLSAYEFIESLTDEQRKQDSYAIAKMMKQITGDEPEIWGKNMIGFGEYHYKYPSGHEGNWFKTGFSPRKKEFSIYIMSGFEKYELLMKDLGKYRTGKSCLYIKKLSDIDEAVLKKLVKKSVEYIDSVYS